jgi:hypothetical protein
MCLGLLVGILSPLIASAAPPLSYQPNLHQALMQRLFGEYDDAHADESMLREHALRVAVALPFYYDRVADASIEPSRYASGAFSVADDGFVAGDSTIGLRPSIQPIDAPDLEPLVGSYLPPVEETQIATAPSPLEPRIAIAPGNAYAGSGVTFTPILSPVAGFESSASGPDANAFAPNQVSAVSLPVAMRLGHMRVQTRFEGAQAQDPALSLNDQSSGLGANFDVRAGRRNVNVDVDSSFEHLTRNDETAFASSNFDGTSTLQVPQGDQLPVLVPAFADVSKHTVTTGVAVPVARRLTFGLQYDAQHLQGGYGVPGLSNLDAQSNTYGANLTLALPHTASAITLSAKQYRYQDNLVPTNTFTSARADLNFTVKF